MDELRQQLREDLRRERPSDRERADLEAAIARVEALADEIARQASESRQVVADFEGVPDRAALVQANRARAVDLDRQAEALRAALRGPEPTGDN